jgi:type VI protein secretion system component VasK
MTHQFAWLLMLAIPVACIAWTITHEEVFREPRDYCQRQSKYAISPARRKFFYLFTCEYCLSHYVALLFLAITRFKLLYMDWRGYLVALFALVWVANQYMSIYNRLRLDIKHEQVEIRAKEEEKEEPARELRRRPERVK